MAQLERKPILRYNYRKGSNPDLPHSWGFLRSVRTTLQRDYLAIQDQSDSNQGASLELFWVNLVGEVVRMLVLKAPAVGITSRHAREFLDRASIEVANIKRAEKSIMSLKQPPHKSWGYFKTEMRLFRKRYLANEAKEKNEPMGISSPRLRSRGSPSRRRMPQRLPMVAPDDSSVQAEQDEEQQSEGPGIYENTEEQPNRRPVSDTQEQLKVRLTVHVDAFSTPRQYVTNLAQEQSLGEWLLKHIYQLGLEGRANISAVRVQTEEGFVSWTHRDCQDLLRYLNIQKPVNMLFEGVQSVQIEMGAQVSLNQGEEEQH